MTYLMWRLHRKQLLVAAASLIVLTAALLLIPRRDNHLIEAIVYATVVVPLLLGLFWGAPLLAREFEDGTNGLAWTQGITRRRWLQQQSDVGDPRCSGVGCGSHCSRHVVESR